MKKMIVSIIAGLFVGALFADGLQMLPPQQNKKPIAKIGTSVLTNDTTTYEVVRLVAAIDEDGNNVNIVQNVQTMTIAQIKNQLDLAQMRYDKDDAADQVQIDYWQGILDSATAAPVTAAPAQEKP